MREKVEYGPEAICSLSPQQNPFSVGPENAVLSRRNQGAPVREQLFPEEKRVILQFKDVRF